MKGRRDGKDTVPTLATTQHHTLTAVVNMQHVSNFKPRGGMRQGMSHEWRWNATLRSQHAITQRTKAPIRHQRAFRSRGGNFNLSLHSLSHIRSKARRSRHVPLLISLTRALRTLSLYLGKPAPFFYHHEVHKHTIERLRLLLRITQNDTTHRELIIYIHYYRDTKVFRNKNVTAMYRRTSPERRGDITERNNDRKR